LRGGKPVLFFQGQNLGLTTAPAVLKSGYGLVGNLPTTNGTAATSSGSLLVITPQGNLGALDPCAEAPVDQAHLTMPCRPRCG